MSGNTSDDLKQAEFEQVQQALDAAGLPSADFGRFTSTRYPDLLRPSVFDYRGSVAVLLDVLPSLHHPVAIEAVVRSLSTKYAKPIAAGPLIELFRSVDTAEDSGLKWAIGNALDAVTTSDHVNELLELVLDPKHGTGRQMIVDRLGRLSGDERIVIALRELATDSDVALHAQTGLRRRLGQSDALKIIEPLLDHPSESVRNGAKYNIRKAKQALKRRKKV